MRLSPVSIALALVLSLGLFTVVVAAAPVVTVTSPNGGELPILDDFTITWSVTADTGLAYFQIFFSHDSASWVEVDSVAGDDLSYVWNVPFELDMTCYLSVFVMDSAGFGGFDNTAPFAIGPRTEDFDFPDGWALLSLPLIPDNEADSIWQILGDDLDHRYVVFGFTPEEGFFWADTMAHGVGYFIGFDEFVPGDETELDVTGTVETADSINIPLVWGWNIICTPFRSRVDFWDQATFWLNDTLPMTYWDAGADLKIHPPVYSFTNLGHIIDDELDPWRAYWFLTLVPGMSVTVYPDPDGPHPAPPERDEGDVSETNWQLDLQAQVDGFFETARSGVVEEASDGFDNSFDFAEPPTPPSEQYVSAYFERPDWDSPTGTTFECDIRAPLQRGSDAEWTFTVMTAQAAEVTLSWPNIDETTPWRNGYTLIDNETNAEIDMRSEASYTFQNENSRSFTIRVHSSLEVGPEVGAAIPNSFGISSIAPNPFNNRSRISFDLSEAADVRLSLVDLAGRTVLELARGDFSAGRHVVALNGERLAGGSYIVRLEGAGKSAAAKLTLVK